jgi:hypothetical protein
MSSFKADHPTIPGSSISSIQRGTISLTGTSATSTITGVDVDSTGSSRSG